MRPAKWPYAGSRSAGKSWRSSRNCRHAWWVSRRAPHRTIGPFGSQLRALKAQIPEFDRRIIAWHRSNATSKRLDAIPVVGPGNHVRRVRPDEPTAGISRAMRYDFCRPERGRAHCARKAWLVDIISEHECRRLMDGAAFAERRVLEW